MLQVKSSENNFIFLPAFYLITCLMKALKNFWKIAILKVGELIVNVVAKKMAKNGRKMAIYEL